MWDIKIVIFAVRNAFLKLSPSHQIHNPVMFTVLMGALLTTLLFIQSVFLQGDTSAHFTLVITLWLWLTLLFANFTEAMAEGRGKAQAQALRQSRREIQAKKIAQPVRDAKITLVQSACLIKDDIVLVEAGDFIPSDGEVIQGIASVNESAITGESAPVIREGGGDRSAVTGGTQVISDWLIVRITSNPGETFIDHMINLVEGAKRQKTPNELALTILLASLTLVFLLVCTTLLPFSVYSAAASGGKAVSITVLVALFICLAPTTIGGLLSAIGIAGMDRMIRANVIALSGRAIEAAGDVDILLLDKTGTITLGDRQAMQFIPAEGVPVEVLANAAQLASFADETPEGRSIIVLAKKEFGLRGRNLVELGATFIPFTAQTRMSGVNLSGRQIRKGSVEAIENYIRLLAESAPKSRFVEEASLRTEAYTPVHEDSSAVSTTKAALEVGLDKKSIKQMKGNLPSDIQKNVKLISRQGGTPLIVAEGEKILGIIHLKDKIKGGIRERFSELREMGIKTIMVTGDHPLTAAAIAAEAGVDDFYANVQPQDKLALIRQLQAEGHLVAMTGDGTNDAPALAQADVAVAMNTGTQAAKEAGNLVDLDSNPTKLIEIVGIGKQLLMTRGAITTFSVANDVAKSFAILPAAFAATYPELNALNIMHLATPQSAILSAVIFNALIIIFLIPLALRGVAYHQIAAESLLRRNVLIYGLGGLVVPFIGIKLIDLLLTF